MNTPRLLLALFACAFYINSSAADLNLEGRWSVVTTCGVNLGNGRPGFTSTSEWSLLTGQTTFVQKGSSALVKEETTWNVSLDKNQVVVSGVGRRDNGDSWEWKLNSTTIQAEKIALNGAMLSNSKQIRDCKIEMARVNVVTSTIKPQVAANSAATSPVAPAIPVAPVATVTPATVVTPVTSTDAVVPVTSAAPTVPVAPVAPVAPTVPVAPTIPVAPAATVTPATAVTPVAPVTPAAAVTPVTSPTSVAPATSASAPPRQSATTVAQTATPPTTTLKPIESIVETIANSPLLDIVILASTKKRDVIQRSIDGNWRVAGDRVCVDIRPLIQTDGRAIPLKIFKELTTTRKDVPSELRPLMLYQMLSHTPAKDESSPSTTRSGFSGPTPMSAPSGIPLKPKPDSGPLKGDLLNSAIADGIEAGLAKQFGKIISVYYVTGSSGCDLDAYAVPRAYMDANTGPALSAQWRSGIDNGSLYELLAIPVTLFRQAIAEKTAKKEKDKQEAEAFILRMAQTPENGEKAIFSAINIGRGKIDACSVLPSSASAPRFGVPIEALMQTEQFKTFLPGRPSSHSKFNSIEELYVDLQLPNGRCTVVLGNGPTIAKLKVAIDRDGQFIARLMPQPVTESQLSDTYAKGLGFETLEMYLFALSVGIQDAQDVSQLNTFGIQTNQQYQAALKRLNDAGLGDSQTPSGLIAFLHDEKEAAVKRTTIKKLRAERAANEQAAIRRQSQAQSAAEKKKAADFPFVAYISCMVGTQKTRIQACMSSRSVQTEIELKNGSEYRMYKMFEVDNIGHWNGEELVVDLRSSFELKAQNADETLTLNVVIKNRATGATVFQKSAAKFGVIAIKN